MHLKVADIVGTPAADSHTHPVVEEEEDEMVQSLPSSSVVPTHFLPILPLTSHPTLNEHLHILNNQTILGVNHELDSMHAISTSPASFPNSHSNFDSFASGSSASSASLSSNADDFKSSLHTSNFNGNGMDIDRSVLVNGVSSSHTDEKKELLWHSRSKEEKKEEFRVRRVPVVRTRRPHYLHQWLDILDTKDKWLEAQIIEMDESSCRFKVHYKGWKPKYDEYFSLDEKDENCMKRVALLHQHTKPEEKVYQGPFYPRMNDRIDVKDTADQWMEGVVCDVDVDHGMLRIHYKGWGAEYDEWINEESYRLAPFNQVTRRNYIIPRQTDSSSLDSATAQANHFTQRRQPNLVPAQATAEKEEHFKNLLWEKHQYEIILQADDGNCLFRSMAHQVYGNPELHRLIRRKCLEYMESERDFFSAFISEPFTQYIQRMSNDGEWGDHVEIQAMSEIYDRPVEIYAYGTAPMKTFTAPHNTNHKSPIRLSYHFASHYNSIIHPVFHHRNIICNEPGNLEDDAIQRSRQRAESGIRRAASEQDNELQAALALSRQSLHQRFDRSQFDEAVQTSLMEFTQKYEGEIQSVLKASEQQYAQEMLIRAAMQESDAEQIEKQILAITAAQAQAQSTSPSTSSSAAANSSTSAFSASGIGSASASASSSSSSSSSSTVMPGVPSSSLEDQVLQRALAESLAIASAHPSSQQADQSRFSASSSAVSSGHDDDLERALAASMQQHTASDLTMIPSVRKCMDLGFPLEMCVEAYSLFNAPQVTEAVLVQSMTDYLIQHTGFR